MAWTLRYWGAHALHDDITQSLAYTKYGQGAKRDAKNKKNGAQTLNVPCWHK